METILCAFDGSAASTKAAEVAADLAKRYGATLNLVYVIDTASQPLELPALAFIGWVEPLRKAANQMLTEASRALAEKTGVHPQFTVLEGDPADQVVDFAGQQPTRFIVCGSRGRSAVKRLLLGSVARKLTQLAQQPVVIVR